MLISGRAPRPIAGYRLFVEYAPEETRLCGNCQTAPWCESLSATLDQLPRRRD
jgi:hypothetical protein